MKSKALIFGLAAAALTVPAFADVTVEITGATAFRKAALASIHAQYVTGGSFKFAHDKTTAADDYQNSTYSVWIGTFPGVAGTTTIRCSFNGSVEGIRALVASPTHDPEYILTSVLDSTTATATGAELAATSTPREKVQSEIAFSDVSVASTPFAASPLEPADSAAGVVVFTMITNQGSPLTNITSQQFRALLTNGYQPLSVFTGNAADTDRVYVTGRNDGSGTRTTYMAESGHGIATPVKQYTALVSSGETISEIQLVPAGGANDTNPGTAGVQPWPGQDVKNASTIWGQDVDGNGGYSSGSGLVSVLGRNATAASKVWNAAHTTSSTRMFHLATWLSLNDAVTARKAGAIICGYNGVKLDGIAASGDVMTAADLAKVTAGSYTAWGYQQMYRRPSLGADYVTVYDGIKGAIGTNLGSAGISISDMKVGREVDGGVVAP
jgi:hypothetical protein